MKKLLVALVLLAIPFYATTAGAQSLRGSRAALEEQNRQARAHDFSYLRTAAQVRKFVAAGLLVPVSDTADFELVDVSYPYARPQAKLFIERLASQFRAACGERLVVTSLTRPKSAQPYNASRRSVHPTGMAMDLRRHNTPACRSWLERVLLQLERSGVLEATLEHHPPHYHVALYPDPYVAYVERITGRPVTLETPDTAAATPTFKEHVVSRGDTLWRIARTHGTTPRRIQAVNDLLSTRIFGGQVLKIPVDSRATE
ncbi:MAG: DUF5715 family protein [Gemmatimonadota bacterium]